MFDQQVTVWDALTRVARCGRAVPFLQGGIVRLVRDEARLLPVALFSPRNIVKNSLKIQYVMPGEETADAVTVEFFSSRTWKPDWTARCRARPARAAPWPAHSTTGLDWPRSSE